MSPGAKPRKRLEAAVVVIAPEKKRLPLPSRKRMLFLRAEAEAGRGLRSINGGKT